jgi:hypothetical protein
VGDFLRTIAPIMNGMSQRWDLLLVDALSLIGFFSPPPLLIWAWLRWGRQESHFAPLASRRTVGFLGLLCVTFQLLGSVVALLVVNAMHIFPANVSAWLSWTRASLICGLVAIALSIIGHSRARFPVIACSLATSLGCIMMASLA